MGGKNRRRGQVIVMVTLALVAMCGIMGLAVDLGWAYYVGKATQAAADAAAIAAVGKAFDLVGGSGAALGAYSSQDAALPGVRCSSVSAGGAFAEGCLYAQRNGFTDNPSGRQAVYVSAGAYSVPPTVPKVGTVEYWVTAVAAERIPQLFSAVMGNPVGGASSRATAAVVWQEVPGSVYALDRQFDIGTPSGGTGNDFYIQGGGNLWSGGDIYLASTAGGGAGPPGAGKDYFAAEGGGGWEVWSQGGYTYIRDSGWTTDPDNFYAGSPKTQADPINGQPDDDTFRDPLRGKGQPPPPAGLADCPILRQKVGGEWVGVISAADSPTGTWGPGNYYTVDTNGKATAERLSFGAGLQFGSGGSCSSGSQSQSGFGDYVFFGGVILPSDYVTFDPGRYVFAGVKQSGSNPGILIDGTTKAYLTDRTALVGGQAVPNTDAGEIFIFTDANYSGGARSEIPLQVPAAVLPIKGQLKFGLVDLHAGGAGGNTEINLHGLNAAAIPEPFKSGLSTFEPVVFWQDQRNSTVKYTPDGYYSCGQTMGRVCAAGRTIDRPDDTTITNGSPEMNLHATPSTHLFGVVYQPRGAWVVLHGGQSQMVAPLQVVSGAYEMRGGPYMILQPVVRPMRRQMVALVE